MVRFRVRDRVEVSDRLGIGLELNPQINEPLDYQTLGLSTYNRAHIS